MGDRRRTIQSNNPPPHLSVPSSIPRPSTSLRQSLAPGGLPGQASANARQSLAPGGAGAGAGGGRMSVAGGGGGGGGGGAGGARHSMAPYATMSAASQQSQGDGASQGLFSQGHGGPREPPMTASRVGHTLYSSHAGYAGGAAGAMGSMSVARSQGALRSSMAQAGGGNAGPAFDYAPPSERRTSTYRRSTMGVAGGPPGANLLTMTPGGGISSSNLVRPTRDPREWKPKRAQERHAEDILHFLADHQCPYQFTLQNLLAPTKMQFQQVFGFLAKTFDPSIAFDRLNFDQQGSSKGQAKLRMEDEVLATLRLMQYPFVDSISKSQLQSVGSISNWPHILAMLHWIVTVIDSRSIAFNSDPELQMPAQDFASRAGSDDVIAHAWFYFLQRSYTKFINGEMEDSWDEDLAYFKEIHDTSTQAQRERIEDLQREAEELEKEWKTISSTEDPMRAYQRRKEEVARDFTRLNEYVVNLTKKMSGYVQQRQLLEQVIEDCLEERQAKQREQERLEQQVKAQKLTPHEITSLNSERQQLTKAIQDVSVRYRAVTEKKMSLEIDLQREIDQAQKLCLEYETRATPLGILDGPVRVEGFENEVYFGQEVNGAAENPVPEGLTSIVKPALQKLRAGTREEIRQLREAQVGLEEEMTKIREVIAEFGDTQTGLSLEFEALDREKVDLNERFERENQATNLELDRMGQQVHAAASTADHAYLQARHRYDQRVLERRQVSQDTLAIRSANRAALETAIDTFMSYKEHMTAGTEKLAALMTEAEEDLKLKTLSR
ncbi:hypothetical protein JCM10212_001038 [Sporobolomyces blumeae]